MQPTEQPPAMPRAALMNAQFLAQKSRPFEVALPAMPTRLQPGRVAPRCGKLARCDRCFDPHDTTQAGDLFFHESRAILRPEGALGPVLAAARLKLDGT